ncbi:hypothetical protein [Bacteroides bouchesdurhonensis]
MKIWQHLVNEDFYKHACLRYFMAYGCSKIVLEYTDNQDNLQKIDILPGNVKTVIYKFKQSSSLKITTYVNPSEKTLEYIPLELEYYTLPDELYDPKMIDRKLFKNMVHYTKTSSSIRCITKLLNTE